jgi:hypothetical protein
MAKRSEPDPSRQVTPQPHRAKSRVTSFDPRKIVMGEAKRARILRD